MIPSWVEVLTPLIPQVALATGIPCALRLGEPPDDSWESEDGCGSSWVSVVQANPAPNSGCDAVLQVQLGFTMCGAPSIDTSDATFPEPQEETDFSTAVLVRAEALKEVVRSVSRRWTASPRGPLGGYAGWVYTVEIPV